MRLTLNPIPSHLVMALLGVCICMLASGCMEHRQVELSPEEQQLMTRLTRDPFMIIETIERDDRGYVTVTTQQASLRSRYIFMPDRIDDKTLSIHHIDEQATLSTAPTGKQGTGPDTGASGRYR